MSDSVSRRRFFQRAFGAAGGASAAIAGPLSQRHPSRAWILVALGWDHDDEFSYVEGEYAQSKVYFDNGEAESACRARCDEFFALYTPQEFGPCWEEYPDCDPDLATWDELRQAGFPDPYYVMELEA